MNDIKIIQILSEPEREFTAVPFWFLNDELSEEMIQCQLRDFAAHGIYGVVLHPRIGLPKRIAYLSDTFFHYIKVAVQAAAKLNMQVVLYDEGMYPSGSAGGKVVEGHPELASYGIALVPAPQPEDEVLAETADGVLVARHSGGTLRGIHFGEDDGEPDVPLSADILNPTAVSRFIELTHEQYYAHLNPYFGNTIFAMFTDEPSILGRNVRDMFPWTAGFAADFTAAGGNLANLAALFRGEQNEDTRLYEQLILQRESNVYYKRLSEWCEEHGIALMGHPHQSDDIEVERWFHIPGQDLIQRRVAPEGDSVDGMESTMAHCGADAALLMGRRRNANECFGDCSKDKNPWFVTGSDIKWWLDWMAVRGVNLFVPHAFYYSVRGARSGERPPDVGPNSIWWPHYRLWARYMQRLSALMTDIVSLDKVAVLCSNRNLVPELAAPLQRNQIGFRYLPESVWKDCRVENGRLVCGEQVYEAVVGDKAQFEQVPHLAPPVCRADKEWKQSTVEPNCICLPWQDKLRSAHFRRADTECWFFVNEGEEAIEADVALPTESLIGCYDLWTGEAWQGEPCFNQNTSDRCEDNLDFECLGSREWNRGWKLYLPRRGSLLMFACERQEYEKLPEKPSMNLSKKQSGVLVKTPEFCLEEDRPENIQKIYRAELDCTKEELEQPGIQIEVSAEEMTELFVNGVSAGVCFWAPHCFSLRPFLKEGPNELRLVVTGNMANRYGRKPVPYGLL
ncbi:MAG: hypothetical protein Q4E24_07800 [bacterium]|nr:hypothetical protein [bacterium]